MYGVEDNETLSEEDIKDGNYMLVDDLQSITDDFVKSENSSLEPIIIWRPYLEELFKGVKDLDLDNRDKVLVVNIDYFKDLAFLLNTVEEEILGKIIYKYSSYITKNYVYNNYLSMKHFLRDNYMVDRRRSGSTIFFK